ncbi:uncharacterized protein METZ01_LOCUS207762, partial [marine metagenome]
LSSIFGGFSYALTPHIFGLINAGHNNKIMAIAFIPWLFFSTQYLFNSRSVKSVLFLSIISSLQLWKNHPQIVYYSWMVIGLWWLWNLLDELIFSSSQKSFYTLGLISLALFLSLMMVVDPYLENFTFQKHSNRGAQSVLDNTDETASGTKWEYATQWSFHPAEVISFCYPYQYGLQNFGVSDRKNPNKFMKQASYWGYMPFTQSTHYMGLLLILLPLLCLVMRYKMNDLDRFELFLWSISILVLIIGFGSHFSLLYKPLFYFAPFFSKFRIPSMIYILLPFTFSFLAASSLDYFFKIDKDVLTNYSIKIFGIFIFLTVGILLFGENLFSFTSQGDSRFPAYIDIVEKIRIDYAHKGLILALFISTSTLVIIWAYANEKIEKNLSLYLIISLLLIDLWILKQEFLHLVPAKNIVDQFRATSEIDYLKKDKSQFRIFPADNINTNKYGYWNIESIGGYRAIKLRNYQDLMDTGGFQRPEVLNMLNVKYLITSQKVRNTSFKQLVGIKKLYENLDFLSRAWLVSDIQNVEDQKSSLSKVMDISFRPKN